VTGLPGALKDVKVLVAVTPDGVRVPVGVDATKLHQLLSEASKGDGARVPPHAPSLPDATHLPRLTVTRPQLEAKFKHAPVFGVTDARGAAGFDAYARAIKEFVDGASTIRVAGTYRGQPVILNFNESTRLVVVQAPDGTFMSGWRMTEAQLRHVTTKRSLGGD
jgi:hypothetical protein